MKNGPEDGVLLSLDIGTGMVRGILFDLQGTPVRKEFEPRHYFPDPSGNSYLKLLDPELLWANICFLIRRLLEKSGVRPEAVQAVSATSQRLSFVFLDGEGSPLYAGPNLDTRGAFTQSEIEERLGETYYKRTGQWPPMLSGLARLLWFRDEAPDVFRRIRSFLTLNDWVLFKLCGRLSAEATGASCSGVLELGTRQWSGRTIEAFGLDPGLFPPVVDSGEVIGEITPLTAEQTGLRTSTPVVSGGADTQCALLGAGLWGDNRFGMVAGTTTPICRTMKSPWVDPLRRCWTSCHLEPGTWILEANAQWTGTVYQWLRDLLSDMFTKTGAREKDVFAWMEKEASGIPAGSQDTHAFLGPSVMDAKNLHVVRPGVFLFPPPGHPLTEMPVRMGHLIRATLENIAFAARANVALLSDDRTGGAEAMVITGGLARSRLFCRIVSDCMNLPVSSGRVHEASALGAAICAAAGAGIFSGIEEAQKRLVQKGNSFEPDRGNLSIYDEAFERWREIYGKIDEI